MRSSHKFSLFLLQTFIFAPIFFASASANSTPKHSVRTHVRDLFVKRETDCGKWTMYCGGTPDGSGGRKQAIEGACNNACYYINVVKSNEGFVAKYNKDTDADRNRRQSGCRAKQGSVCNSMPFSQRFHDPFERVTNVADQQYNCDEFPMARMSQPDFGSGVEIRNSLRCIDKKENSGMNFGTYLALKANNGAAAGSQLQNFIQGVGEGLAGRTCDGPLPDDAIFTIDFNYDDADTSRLGFCKDLPTPPQKDPWFQFYVTKLGGGESGSITFPLQDSDNQYAIGTTHENVVQSLVEFQRNWKTNSTSGTLAKDGDSLIVPAAGLLLPLTLTATGPVGGKGGLGSKIKFLYGNPGELGTEFEWSTGSHGTDPTLSNKDQYVSEGGYCAVPPIPGDEGDNRQGVSCWFPCNVRGMEAAV